MRKNGIEAVRTTNIIQKTFDIFSCAFLQHQIFDMRPVINEVKGGPKRTAKCKFERKVALYLFQNLWAFVGWQLLAMKPVINETSW